MCFGPLVLSLPRVDLTFTCPVFYVKMELATCFQTISGRMQGGFKHNLQ